MTYLTDLAYNKDYPAPTPPDITVQAGDCLGIVVTCDTPELAAPFNQFSGDGNVLRYVVDKNGNIDFPVLGTINIWGRTLNQIKNGIAAGIRENGLIRDPVVNVTLENFNIIVIGRAGNRILPVKGESINLLQVIAQSDNPENRVNIKDVMVVRTEDGVMHPYTVNLRSKDLFYSPVFYLKQNDVVYLKPQGVSLSASGQTAMSFATVTLSLASIITNMILWSRR